MKRSAGVIIIDAKTQDEPTVLCLRAYSNWDFPKGAVEKDEQIAVAAFRELEEETGYKFKDVKLNSDILGRHIQVPVIVSHGKGKNQKQIILFLSELSNFKKEPVLKVNPELGKPEHDEWRWVKISELEALMPKHFAPVAKMLNKLGI